MPTVPPLPKDYSAEMFCPNGDRLMRVYVRGLMERSEMSPKNRPPVVRIRRPDKGVVWSILPHANTYTEAVLPRTWEAEVAPLLEPFVREEWTEDGTEIIDNRKCWRYIGRYCEVLLLGQTAESHSVCYVDIQTGERRRECHYDRNGELVARIDYLAVSPPPTLFELPQGCIRLSTREKM